MTCDNCKKLKNQPFLCKIGFHKMKKDTCIHEEDYDRCLRCGIREVYFPFY